MTQNLGAAWRNSINAVAKGPARNAYLRDNYEALIRAEAAYPESLPQAANTTSGTVTTSLLNGVVTTTLQNQLAPFSAFGIDTPPDANKPEATVVSKKVTSGGAVQTNATNFEDATNFVATATAVGVAVSRYTGGGHLTPAELNSGYRLADWGTLKASEFADKLWDVVSALFTTTNFPNTPFIAAAAAFGGDDMNTLWAMITKANPKNLVVDGSYFARLLGRNTQEFNGDGGDVRNLRWPGWGTVGYSTRWSAAGSGVYGYAGAPQGLRIVAGVPLVSPNAARAGALIQTVTMPGIGIPVQFTEWYAHSGRSDWFTFDSILGAAVDDATAGLLIKGS